MIICISILKIKYIVHARFVAPKPIIKAGAVPEDGCPLKIGQLVIDAKLNQWKTKYLTARRISDIIITEREENVVTAYEVAWFINHKYGEQAYVIETEQQILIFTAKSKWIVQKTDYRRFHFYTLFHSNNTQGYGYHVQMRGNHIDYLVYCAIMHDNGLLQDWNYFLRRSCS